MVVTWKHDPYSRFHSAKRAMHATSGENNHQFYQTVNPDSSNDWPGKTWLLVQQ